jgi:hypothetical protein
MITSGDGGADAADPVEVLQRYRKRRIRGLLDAMPDDHAEPIIAIFALVYDGAPAVDHDTAVAVLDELRATDKTVGDLIDGWRPRAFGVRA